MFSASGCTWALSIFCSAAQSEQPLFPSPQLSAVSLAQSISKIPRSCSAAKHGEGHLAREELEETEGMKFCSRRDVPLGHWLWFTSGHINSLFCISLSGGVQRL